MIDLLHSSQCVLIFYSKAQHVWFMSEEQMAIFLMKIGKLKESNCSVLSSVFEKRYLDKMKNLSGNKKNNRYAIINSKSWIKGVDSSIKYAKENNLSYDLIQSLEYDELLKTLSSYSGLIFFPKGKDTCPRIVIEAYLLGLKCITNENVQHKNEEWFQNRADCLRYLETNADRFWKFYE